MGAQSPSARLPASAGWVWRIAVFGTVLVLLLGYALEISGLWQGVPSNSLGFNFFRLDEELSLPPIWAAALMLTIAVLTFRTGRAERASRVRTSLGWTLLGVGFVYLALDEALALHEFFSRWAVIPDYDFLRHRWLAVGIPAVAVVTLLFTPFLLRVPRPTALRLVVAGAVFLGGAMGVAEEIVRLFFERFVNATTIHVLSYTMEETFEFLGLMLGLRAMLLHRAAATVQDAVQAGPALRTGSA
jgi:energy-converting hydrogenase Eha subunit E